MSSIVTAQSPIGTVDRYFNLIAENETALREVFADKAVISTVNYDTAGESYEKVLSIDQYIDQLASLHKDYETTQKPIVLIKRIYGPLASYYCSVWMQFVDNTSHDTLIARSMQSVRLVKTGSHWKIAHVQIQMEHPSYPISKTFWPEDITSKLNNTSKLASEPDENIYDPNRIYKPDEVEEVPVYPGPPGALQKLMEQFDVIDTPAMGFTPFLVTIAEDGSPELSYSEDLSGFQLTRAQSFVRSMMIWYPAVKSAASVKCKLLFYIHE